MRLRSRMAIYAAKLTDTLIHKMKRGTGSALPGLVARIIEPKILSVLSTMVREGIIVTTGTNGKTTTNGILCKALEAEGKTVVCNRTGANMLNGVVTAFVLATGKKRCLKADYACIEVDEIAAGVVLPQLTPDAVILTNIFRDQLDRFGEVDITCDKLHRAALGVPKAKLVVNGDDSLSYALKCECRNPAVIYGISERIFDEISGAGMGEDIFCRICGKKLKYEFFHYGQLGIYHCPNCGFGRPKPDYTLTNIAFRNGRYCFELEGQTIESGARAPYNVYNTLAAYAALCALRAPRSRFRETVEAFDYGNNRESSFFINGACVQLHLAKNPVGFQQKLSLLGRDSKPKDVLIQINDASQDGKDISWLWDVDFHYLKCINAAAITISGTRRHDMALRLKYEDIPCEDTANLKEAVRQLTRTGTGNLYVIVNYSGLYETKHILEGMQETKNN